MSLDQLARGLLIKAKYFARRHGISVREALHLFNISANNLLMAYSIAFAKRRDNAYGQEKKKKKKTH